MILIETTPALIELCNKLENEDSIAIDTEFVRDKTFMPELCLVQIATEHRSYIIDMLKVNIEPLKHILTKQNLLKVFHSSRQDIDVFYKNFNFIPMPIFDTQIASQALGLGENISYKKLVKSLLRKDLPNQNVKFTNWLERPLRPKQLEYAALDVKYLIAIYKKLISRLKRKDRVAWAEEDTVKLYDKKLYEIDPDSAWKRITNSSPVPYFLNFLKHYAALREEICIKENKLRRFVISDDILVELAKLQPKSDEEIKQNRLLAAKINKKLWPDIFNVHKIIKANGEKEIQNKKNNQLNANQEMIVDLLKILLKYCAIKNKIAIMMITTSEEIKQFVKNRKNIGFLTGWRYEVFGKYAEDLIEGKVVFGVDTDLGETKITFK